MLPRLRKPSVRSDATSLWSQGSAPIRVGAIGLLLLLGGVSGCQEEDPIRRYSVDKPPAPIKAPLPQPEPVRSARPAVPERTDPTTDRILGAMIPRGDQTWFFKLQGPVKTTRPVLERFLFFIRELRFENNQPVWDLPDGWKRVENNSGTGRFATVAIDTDGGPLELAVTALETPKSDLKTYLLMNVNRWRGQLQRSSPQTETLEECTVPIQLEDDSTAWLVHLEGWSTGASGPSARPPVAAENEGRPPLAAPKLPFAYKVPEHWTVDKPKMFGLAAWKVQDSGESVSITVSTAGGDLTTNINRWRGQVALPAATEAELRESIQKIPMGSATGSYVSAVAPEGTENPQTILGVIVSVSDTQFFFKLQGNRPLAAREQQNFEAFVKSVQFP